LKHSAAFAAMEQALLTDPVELSAKVDRELVKFRIQLLDRLANGELDSTPVQRTLARLQPEHQSLYTSAQNNLRKLWDQTTPFFDKQRIVDAWVDVATKRLGLRGLHAWLARERLEFDFDSFPGQFVTAILENWRKFRVCGNPNCPGKFFLAKRSNSRYCERGDCTKYAQQQHALRWWREKGSDKRKGRKSK
jgi:hypothetical protein